MNASRSATDTGPNASLNEKLFEWLGKDVVLDFSHPYVAIGTLVVAATDYLELHDADLHDLRDTATSRETYVVKVARHGIGVNRRVLTVRMDQVVAISPLEAVVAE